jgi:hypothetical protein
VIRSKDDDGVLAESRLFQRIQKYSDLIVDEFDGPEIGAPGSQYLLHPRSSVEPDSKSRFRLPINR